MNAPSIRFSQERKAPVGELVNDMHSGLNQTRINKRVTPNHQLELVAAVASAQKKREKICIAGGRHSMGGQQFATGGTMLDMTDMNRVLQFDDENGLVEVESGMCWPELISFLKENQAGQNIQWTIAQKQTGCDRLSIGGALASNIHGRGFGLKPIIGDVENFTIVLPDGQVKRCDRENNEDLFSLAIGGYGLFGVTSSVTLRLVPKTSLQRQVELIDARNVVERMESLKGAGATYGDFQFAIDHESPDFLKTGILSTYTPVESASVSKDNRLLTTEDWSNLLLLAHTNKSAAFERYSRHYLATNGQLYNSDTFQLATYIDNYHSQLDERLGSNCPGSEMISELYVPRSKLSLFLSAAADLLRSVDANVIYGTVRLIEKDDESFLAWAKEPWACTVLNLHVDHCPNGIESAKRAFKALIDLAIAYGGCYYLTYHRFASRRQVLSCYPEMPEFLERKLEYDPNALFSSDWYEHHRALCGQSDLNVFGAAPVR